MNISDYSLPKPDPDNQKEKDLYSVIDEFIRDVRRINNRGISIADNVDCKLITVSTNATPDTEDTTAHGLGKIPTGFIVYEQNKAGSLYKSKTYTSTNIYTKCNVASVTFKVIVF